jgi:hypothetical protein
LVVTLNTAVERYHERCRFYAWDVYDVLSRSHKRLFAILQYVSRSKEPVTLAMVSEHLPGQRRGGTDKSLYRNISTAMCELDHLGLIYCSQPSHGVSKGGKTPKGYNISEFGRMVLSFHGSDALAAPGIRNGVIGGSA